ncbi:phosphatidate cytidylyltransferase [Enterococcus olivae]
MRQRVITAVVALALFLPVIYFDFGGVSVALLGAAMAVVGVYELFRMKGLAMLSFEGVLSALGAVLLVLPEGWFLFLPEGTDRFMLFYLVVMLLLGISVISKNTYTIDEAAFPVIVSLYVGVGFQNFVSARVESLIILCFGLFVVWATDIGAYMFGRHYGQRKLWPDISPNKTIEGAAGGILSAVVVAFFYLLVFPGNDYFGHGTFVMLLLTIIFSVVGQFGDLVESAIKRHYGVKDSGNILPGHGGILDRFDSLLFVFPIMHLLGVF